MARTITYEFPVELHTFDDEDYYDEVEFDYEVDDDIVKNTLVEIFADFYGLDQDTAQSIIFDYDLLDAVESEFEYLLNERLVDICYDDALKKFEASND